MQTYSARPLDATKILSRRELAAVLNDLKRKAPRSKNTRLNLALFRLACCCGLRNSEIAKLRVGDVRTELARPHIRIRNGASKGGRPRIVPLWWDAGTLKDLAAWKAERLRAGAEYDEPFLASLIPGRPVKTFSRHAPEALSDGVQSPRRRSARGSHHPSRPAHVYQPRAGWWQITGRGAGRRGARQRKHHERLFACRGR
jgi:integrase